MSGYILCPECENSSHGELYKVVKLIVQGFHNKTIKDYGKIDRSKIDLHGNILKPIGHILDDFGIKLLCCRMHMMGSLNVAEEIFGYESIIQNEKSG